MSKTEKLQFFQKWASCKTVNWMAKKLGLSKCYIRAFMREMGIDTNQREKAYKQKEEFVLSNRHLSVVEIANKGNLAYATVVYILRKNGLDPVGKRVKKLVKDSGEYFRWTHDVITGWRLYESI